VPAARSRSPIAAPAAIAALLALGAAACGAAIDDTDLCQECTANYCACVGGCPDAGEETCEIQCASLFYVCRDRNCGPSGDAGPSDGGADDAATGLPICP
jgi:hypothetical protein